MRSMRNVFSLDPVDAEAQRQAQPKPAPEPTFQRPDGGFDYLALSAEYKVPPNIIRATTELGGVDGKQAASVLADAMKRTGGDVPTAIKSILGDDAASQQLLDHAASLAQFPPAAAKAPDPVRADRQPGKIEDTARMFGGGVVKGSGAAVEGAGRAVDAINPRDRFDAEMTMGEDGSPDLKLTERGGPSSVVRGATEAADKMRGVGEAIQAGVSDVTRRAIENSTPEGDITDYTTWSMGKDPSLLGYFMLTADVMGSMAPVIAAAVAGGPAAAMGVGGTQSAGSGAELAREEIAAAAADVGPDGVSRLERESAYYRELVASGVSPDEALARTSHAGEQLASLFAGGVGALGGLATGAIVSKGVAPLAGRSMATRVAGTAAISGAEEAVQETAETLASRTGVEQGTGLDVDLTEGTFGDALLGFLGGAVTGGASGVPRRDQEQQDPEGDAPLAIGQDQPPMLPPPPLGLPAPDEGAAPQGTIEQSVMEGDPEPEAGQMPMGGQPDTTSGVDLPQAPIDGGVPETATPAPDMSRPPMGPLSMAASRIEAPANPAPPPKSRVRVTTPEGADLEAVFESEDADGLNLRFNNSPWRIPRQDIAAGTVSVTPIDPIKEDADRRAEEARAEAEKEQPVTPATAIDDDIPDDMFPIPTPDQASPPVSGSPAPPATPATTATNAPEAEADDLSVITKDGEPFKNMVAVRRAIEAAGQSPADYDTVQSGGGYIARRKDPAAQIDAAAQGVEANPTDAQKEAGNYKKGHTRVQGLDITIENAKGSERSGKDGDGKPWSVTMPAHYGYIRRTEGADGDHVDVYLGDMPDSDAVFIVNQIDPDTGAFDEHKIIMGVGSRAQAERLYQDGFSDGRGKERMGSVTATTMEGFKAWLKDGDQTKPTEPVRKVEPAQNVQTEQNAQNEPEPDDNTTPTPDAEVRQGDAGEATPEYASPMERAVAEAIARGTVTHTTKRNKELTGYVVREVEGLNLVPKTAKEIDKYAFRKDGGWFMREDDVRAAFPDLFDGPADQEPVDNSSDTKRFLDDREARVSQSKASGAKHLDDYNRSVEAMRGLKFASVHDPKEQGVVRTVANTGDVVVNWSDKYSADKNLVEDQTRDGKAHVWQSWLMPSDLKDYVVTSSTDQKPVKSAEPEKQGQPDETPAADQETVKNSLTVEEPEERARPPIGSPEYTLIDAMNDLMDMQTEAEAQGMIGDARLASRIERQKALVKRMESEADNRANPDRVTPPDPDLMNAQDETEDGRWWNTLPDAEKVTILRAAGMERSEGKGVPWGIIGPVAKQQILAARDDARNAGDMEAAIKADDEKKAEAWRNRESPKLFRDYGFAPTTDGKILRLEVVIENGTRAYTVRHVYDPEAGEYRWMPRRSVAFASGTTNPPDKTYGQFAKAADAIKAMEADGLTRPGQGIKDRAQGKSSLPKGAADGEARAEDQGAAKIMLRRARERAGEAQDTANYKKFMVDGRTPISEALAQEAEQYLRDNRVPDAGWSESLGEPLSSPSQEATAQRIARLIGDQYSLQNIRREARQYGFENLAFAFDKTIEGRKQRVWITGAGKYLSDALKSTPEKVRDGTYRDALSAYIPIPNNLNPLDLFEAPQRPERVRKSDGGLFATEGALNAAMNRLNLPYDQYAFVKTDAGWEAVRRDKAGEKPRPQTIVPGPETPVGEEATQDVAQPATPAAPDVPPAMAYGAQNKLVSADRAAEIRARLKDKLRNQTNAGIDPEILALGAELAVFHIEAGSRKFIDMTRAVAADLDMEPKDLKRYLRSWYNGARDMMEDSDVSVEGMDDAETVGTLMRSGAIDNLNAKLPEAQTPATVPPADNETNEAADNDTESEPLRVDPPEALEGLAPDSLQGNEGGRDAEPDGAADRPLDSRQRTGDDGAGDASRRGRGGRSGRAVSRPRKRRVDDSQPALAFAAAQSEQIADTSRQNFRITKDLRLGQGGPTEKFNDNVAAIETLKRIEAENRPATASEQAVLARYVGWGGLKNAFRVQGTGDVAKGWEDKVAQIEALLEPEELKAARNSTRAAHYTSETIVTGIWKLAERLGFAGGAVLEPSAGTGNFLGLMPDSARGKSKVMAVEYDSITARIAKQLYPQAAVYHTGFQNVPLPEGQFSLAIGNPPFGTDSLFFQHLPEMNRKSIHNQFFGASLHALAPDGLLTMVVSRYLMDAQDRSNRLMMARKAELVGAIRLPSSAFQENARTEVVTDILAFRRHNVPKEVVDAALARIEGVKEPSYDAEYSADVDRLEANFRTWLDVSKFEDPAGSGEVMSMNDYFHQNKRLVLGDIAATGTMRRNNELNVTLPAADIAQRLDIAINSIPAAAPRDSIATRTAARFETLAKAMEMAARGVEPGSVTMTQDGKLMAAVEQMDDADNAILTEIEITADTPYTSAYFLGTDGKWRRETDVLDDKGKPVKVKTPEGKVTARNEKQIEVITNPDSIAAAAKWGQKRVDHLRDMLPIRDAFRRQVQLESEPEATKARVEENRKKLKAAYDAFKKAHGPLHQPRVRAIADAMPDGGLILAVEDIVSKPGAPLKVQDADILSKRVLMPPAKITKADSIADAISISLSETGGLDMQRIADLMGTDIPAIEKALSDGENPRGFYDPEQSKWVTADEYLSGEVRRKLAAAEMESLEANVKALEKVAPEPWGPAEITPSMGANWIPPEVYGDFLRHIGFDSGRVRYQALTNTYFVEAMGKAGAEWSTTESRAWSTDKIIETVMNSGPIKVTYKVEIDGSERTVVDEDATRESQEKAEELQNEFQDWVFTEDARRDKLVQIFNNKYNTRVTRQRDGSHLTLPGKNPDIVMRRHQNNAIWRGITDNVVLYDHVVGAGKTYTAIARIMERRRMGLTRKPMVVVPNHLTEQWGADWKEIYPGAKLLVAGKADFTKANRRRMFARIAAGDYDGIIIGHSQIGMISIDPSIEIGYLEQELKDAMKAIKDAEEQAREDGTDQGWRKPVGVAEAERMANKLEERMQRVRAKSRDKLITFQQMGVDDLTIDEAHEFKNLAYSSRMTNTAGMGNKAGSQKALDLHMKMRSIHDAGHSAAFLTGTPISNSVAEMYLVLRNLAPNELREMGLENFDAWRTMFVTASSEWEPTEAGGLKEVVRLGREWTNMRTLMDLYYSVSDAVTIDDIKRDYPIDNNGAAFPIPRVKNVKEGETRRLVAVTPGPETSRVLDQVVRGFDSLPNISDVKERNIERLKLMDKARKIALDPRAVDPGNAPDPEGGKIAAVVGEVTRIYREWDGDKGTQIVFLDRSVPKAKGDEKIVADYDAAMDRYMKAQQDRDEAKIAAAIEALDKFDANDIAARRNAIAGGWNAYDDIKARLIENGIPAEEIAFVQEANNDTQKAQLFARVKSGEVRILIGSTPRMGAGTNVQDRLVALHHVDVTWKPSDIEQREGRIIRQKNKLLKKYGMDEFGVEVIAYATERTVDAKMWDLNGQKLKAINGIRKYDGSFSMEFEDADSASMAEMAALATGNTLMVDRIKLEGARKKLMGKQRTFNKRRNAMRAELQQARRAVAELPGEIAQSKRLLPEVEKQLDTVKANTDARSITIDGTAYQTADEAEAGLTAIIEAQQGDTKKRWKAKIGDLDVTTRDDASKLIRKAFGTRGFTSTIAGVEHIDIHDAARALHDAYTKAKTEQADLDTKTFSDAEINGFPVDLVVAPGYGGTGTQLEVSLMFDGEPAFTGYRYDKDGKFSVNMMRAILDDLVVMADPMRVERRIRQYEKGLEDASKRITDLEREVTREFPAAAELQGVTEQLDAVIAALGARGSKDDAKASYGAPASRPVVATLTGQELGVADNIKALRAAGVTWYRSNLVGKVLYSPALGGDIQFTRRGSNKSVSTKGEDLVRLIPALQAIVTRGTLVGSEPARDPSRGVKTYHTIAARVMLDGKAKDVVVKVRETTSGRFHYDLSRDMSGGARFRVDNDQVPAQLQTASLEADTAALNISDDTPEVNFSDAVAAMDQALSEAGIKSKVTAEVIEGLTVAGRAAMGRYVAGGIAIDPASPDLIGTARHEVIHAARDPELWGSPYGLFSRKEWQTMVRAAQRDRALMDRIKATYKGQSSRIQTEEAVAERYRRWMGAKDATGPLRRAFQRMKEVLEAIANGLAGAGFQSEASVFRAVANGDVGLRGENITPGAGSQDPRALLGFTPQSPFVTATGRKRGLKELAGSILTKAMIGGSDGQYSGLALVPGRALLAEMARPLPGAQRYLSFKEKMDAMRNELHNEMDKTAKAWRALLVKDRDANKAMMDLMHESTIRQIDPSKRFVGTSTPRDLELIQKYRGTKTGDSAMERVREDQRRRELYRDLKAKYDALPADFQAMYRTIRDEYTKMAEAFEKAILANAEKAMEVGIRRAERAYEKRVQQINDDGLKGKARREAMAEARQDLENAKASNRFAAQARLMALRATFESNRLQGPYFPLARFGKLFVTVRDELGQVVSFSRFERQYGTKEDMGQMDFADDMRARGYNVEVGTMADFDASKVVDPTFVADIEELMGEIGASPQVMDEIWQRWLHTLPDMSVRTNRIHRKGTPGYAADAFRAFGYNMNHGAHQLARLTYGIDLQHALEDAREDARSDPDPVRAGLIVNEMQKRHQHVMNPMSATWAYHLTTLAFVWYLSVTPAAAISNITQTTVVGIPILAADYGKGGIKRASTEITRALGDFTTGKGEAENSNRLTADEKAAMSEAYRRGIVDKSQAHDLTGVGETGAEYSRVRTAVMEKIAWFFHHAERMNREVTFLAAYRLSREKGLGHEQAIAKAGDLTWRSHFDYQASSRPRIMQDDWLRVFLVFKNFQTNMLWRLFRDIHQSVEGRSPELREEARRQLIGITASMFLHAGIKGVWGYALLKTLLGMFLPGDGEEIEEEMEQALLAVLPKDMVAAFLHGVPGTLMGIDVTSRWGMPELWFRAPNRDMEGSSEYQYWVGELIGAVPGIAEGFFRGAQSAKDGEYWKGFENAVPKWMRDISKSIRYGVDGATTYNGNIIIDDFSAGELAAQFSGFTPARLARQYELNARDKNAEQRIIKARGRTLRDVRKEVRTGNGISPATQRRIAEFNQEYPFYAIDVDTIMRSIKSGERSSQNTRGGVYINPKLAPYIDSRRPLSLYD